jgi:hypothetical protein
MLQGITKKAEIKSLRDQLIKKLSEIEDVKITIKYSSKGGVGNPVRASYSEKYDFWWYFDGKEDQYWNPFGLGRPRDNQSITGRCQINMPHEGLKRKVAGAFAKDEAGNIYLLHNGTVGGGIPGINKFNFLKWFPGKLHTVNFEGLTDEYFIVAEFSAKNFHDQILFFVQQVYRFKDDFKSAEVSQTIDPKSDQWLDYGESLFRNPFTLPERELTRSANHAIITNALLTELRKLGYKALRNRKIDTFIVGRAGKLSHLFEVKSTLTTQSFYTAIGQLVIYGLNHEAKRIIVFEGEAKPDLIEKIQQINISYLGFIWNWNKPVFLNLLDILK